MDPSDMQLPAFLDPLLDYLSEHLPPELYSFLTFLAAYFALLSLYRTTSWMFRTTFWCLKWGAILAALAAGAGWYMGNQDAGGRGLVSSLGGAILGMLNTAGQDAAGARRERSPQTPRNQGNRPKSWESFEKHQQWQYQEETKVEREETKLSRSSLISWRLQIVY
ncbi:hypothetical protein BU15DRAFT_87217 [Melanogaster broomeanus]|nr:hypothetical protein BU15DRAFT_87217 [Melanogaster broomeanus]